VSPTSKSTRNLQDQFQLLSNSASEVSAKLERGQAEMPITTAIQLLREPPQEQPLQLSLLNLEDMSQDTMRYWFDGTRQNVQLTVVESIEQLQEDSSAYQNFCTRGHVLIVASRTEHELTEATADFLSNLTENFKVVWPIVFGPRPGTTTEGWWEHTLFHSHTGRLEALFLLPGDPTQGGEVLTDEASPLRCALLFERQVRTLQGAIHTLDDRQQRELNALTIRQQLLEDQAKATNPRQAVFNEKEIAQLREQWTEQLTLLEKQINLKSERATQPLGKLTNLMRENVSRLRIEDLDKQQSATLLKLSIHGSHLAAINRTIEHALREEIANDVANILSRLRYLTQEATNRMSSALGGPVTLSTAPLLETPIWRTVENLMAIGKESHIELARKGIFDMLTAGRQKVFILIMFVSLMGRMGLPNLFQTGLMRTGFGLFMAAVLIGSMINAVFVWRREKESQSGKEMSKIKDTLFSDGTKVIEQVEKGKINFLRDYFRKVGKDFDKQLKQAQEEQSGHRKTENDAATQRQNMYCKKLNTQIKAATDLGRQIIQLTADADSLHVSSANAIRDVARQHKTDSSLESSPLESPTDEQLRGTENQLPSDRAGDALDEQQPVVVAQEMVASSREESGDKRAHMKPPQKTPPKPRRASALEQRRSARRLAREQDRAS